MTFNNRLVSIARWRWMTSVGVIAVACLPMAGAILFIPSEIGAPRTLRTAPLSDAPTKQPMPTPDAPATLEKGPSATPTTLPEKPKELPAPKAMQESPSSGSTRLAALHGSFVPPGEADDSEPLETRRVR